MKPNLKVLLWLEFSVIGKSDTTECINGNKTYIGQHFCGLHTQHYGDTVDITLGIILEIVSSICCAIHNQQ